MAEDSVAAFYTLVRGTYSKLEQRDIIDFMITIREIRPTDNRTLANLVRSVFEELQLPLTHSVYDDPQTDCLFEVFQTEKSAYFVAEEDGVLLGGCGYYPTEGLPEGYAELVKYYFRPASRGKGLGSTLMKQVISKAIADGYTHLYIESFPQCGNAVAIYEKYGFVHLPERMGNSGHTATTIHMVKELLPID